MTKFHDDLCARSPGRPRPHRRRSRPQPQAAVRFPAHPVDLDRPGLQGPMQGSGRFRRQGPRRPRLRDQRAADRRPSDRGRQGRQRTRQERRPARSVLRPLRRAAGRSARPVGDAAVRAAHRHLAGRPQDHRRARRLRRQRPGDDLRRGAARLQGGHRQAAAPRHHDDRGRGGVRLEPPVRLRQGQRRRAQAGPRAGLRHQHVGREDADGDDLAARPRLRGGARHLRRSRSAFRPVRRRGAKSDPRARQDPRRACTTRTAGSPSPASTTA